MLSIWAALRSSSEQPLAPTSPARPRDALTGHSRPQLSPGGPWPQRRRTHQLALPNLRLRHVRAAVEHALHMSRRADDRAHLPLRLPTVAGRQLCVMDKRAAVRSASTPCQLRVTSFASKCRLVDRHPLYVPACAAPHVRASHYGLRLAHDSKHYTHPPKITTDWQTQSAGDEELTTSPRPAT